MGLTGSLLLLLSRIGREGVNLEWVDLTAMVREIAEEQHRLDPARQVDVAVEAGLAACADPRLLGIALTNLFGNARKYTATTPDAAIAFGAAPGDGAATFYIRDNGVGFDAAQTAELFKPFKRFHTEAEFGGTGIGLTIVERVIRKHGGRIWAQGTPGGGAVFYFTLGVESDRPDGCQS